MSADVKKTDKIAKHQNKIFMIRTDFPVCVDCMKQTSFKFTEKQLTKTGWWLSMVTLVKCYMTFGSASFAKLELSL